MYVQISVDLNGRRFLHEYALMHQLKIFLELS